MGCEMEVKDNSYWDAYEAALSAKLESDWEQYHKEQDEIDELERQKEEQTLNEASAALRAERASYRLIDYSGDDSSLDSRYH